MTPVERDPTTMHLTYAERATVYAERVAVDETLACLYVRQACQRHLDDLARKDFPYHFDHEHANYVCAFVETMPHVKGEWGMRGELIVLEDWQCFMLCLAWGWLDDDDLRRFRRCYWEIPRKNAKSTITAAVANFMLVADYEFGSEVYIGATTEKQAHEVFEPARQMAIRHEFEDGVDGFAAHYGVEIGKKNLSVVATNSKLEPVIGNPGDGASPHFAVTDEYHEHREARQLDTMITGMGSRRQPMSWVITTAGIDTSGPCFSLRSEVINMLAGNVENDRLLGAIWTLDEDDDWSAPESLRKANPNYDVSVFGAYLLDQQLDAINDPVKQNTFKMKHANVWTGAASPFFNAEKWARLGDAPEIEEFAFQSCHLGLDLAAKIDLAAKVLVFEREEVDGRQHFYAYLTAYIPQARVDTPGMGAYRGWALSDHLTATPGDIIDYDQIEADVVDDSEQYRIVELGFDPHNATQLIGHIAGHGVPCVEVPQTVLHLSEPMKEVQALIEDGRLHHDGNPVFSWAMGNVTAQIDRNENVFPRKERRENKIDPAVALIIAMARVLRSEGPVESTYSGRGLTVI